MADIELLIKIPKDYYDYIKNISDHHCTTDMLIIKNGIPIPGGHGKIIDADKIEWYGCTTEADCPHKDRACKDCPDGECSKTQVDNIQPIIDADIAESEVNNIGK